MQSNANGATMSDWRDVAKLQRVKLFKYVDGQWKHVDYGFRQYADKYVAKGYVVEYENGK